MGTVRVREAVARDLPALQRIEVEAAALFPSTALPLAAAAPMSLAELRACLASTELWVAELDHAEPVGFIAARTHGASLHLIEMDVLPRMGRRGIGTMLLQHVFHAASQRGCAVITLTTFEDLPWNAPFYAKNGFTEVADFTAFPHLVAALQAERESGFERRTAMIKSTAQSAPKASSDKL